MISCSLITTALDLLIIMISSVVMQKPVVVAISIVSHAFITFTLGVSCYTSLQVQSQPADFRSISSPLSNISIMVAAADGILLLVCILTDIVAFLVAVSIASSCPFDCAFIVLSCTGFMLY